MASSQLVSFKALMLVEVEILGIGGEDNVGDGLLEHEEVVESWA